MRRLMMFALLWTLPTLAVANDLALLDDEFESETSLSAWSRFDQRFGWPDKIRQLDIGRSAPGLLTLQPYHSAWVRDLNAPFLFKEISGDFDVRARVRVRGGQAAVAGGTWSLGGLMARVPLRGQDRAEQWQPRRENWHFITTGVGHVAGESMIETKGTFNSHSSLKLRPAPAGWMELRLVRVGMSLVALARAEGEGRWQVRDRWYRMENDPRMQVGLIAYTTSGDVAPGHEDAERINLAVEREARTDMQMEVDWLRFTRPVLAAQPDWYAQVSANPLAGAALSDAQVLALIGE